MEKRVAKINISAAGGTAARGAKTCKVTLPTAWVEALGLDKEHRELELAFDGTKIILSRRLSGPEFAAQKCALKHKVYCLHFYDEDKLCTIIYADFTDETLWVENYVANFAKTAFGNNHLPHWADFQAFLQKRCTPQQETEIQKHLNTLDITEHNLLEMIERTGGRINEDHQWIEIKKLL